MSNNHHTPIVTGASNSPDTVNNPLGELDSQLTLNTNEIVAGRSTYASLAARFLALNTTDNTLDDRIDDLIIASGTSDAETIAARTAVPYLTGSPPSTLGDALDYAAGDIANVLAFGADNTGVSDCSTAVQAALTAHSIVYFPPGTYLFTAQVTTGSDRRIIGHGATLKGSGATPILIDGDNVTVRDLRFLGTLTNHTSNTGDTAIQVDATANHENIRIVDCVFEWMLQGISFKSPAVVSTSITLIDVRISGCTFRDLMRHAIDFSKSGATLQSNYKVRNLRITDCHLEDIYHTDTYVYAGGIYLAGGVTLEDLVISNCTARHCITSWMVSGSNGYIDKGTISNCSVSGLGATTDNRMGMEITNSRGLTITGCTFDYVAYECLTLFACENFTVSGCTFRRGNIGVALYESGSTASYGTITGCAFEDIEDKTVVGNTGKRGILLADAIVHRCVVSNCTFTLDAAAGGTGIYLQDAAHELDVNQCSFYDLTTGIDAAGSGLDYRLTISQCRFYSMSNYGVNMRGQFLEMVLSDCYFNACVTDFRCGGFANYLRAANNTHVSTTTAAYEITNGVGNQIYGCVFRDVAAVVTGTGRFTANGANYLFYRDNILVGTSTAPAWNQGLMRGNVSSGNVIASGTAAPTSGTWARGDVFYNTSPTAGGTIGWVCTVAGTPGTWKTFGAITA